MEHWLYMSSLPATQPAWDVCERSQSNLHWERYVRDLSETSQKRCLFCDVFKTSQNHLKKDVFCVMSLRRLGDISKKMSFQWHLWDVSKTSNKYVAKMILCDFCRLITMSDKTDVGPSETLRKWNVLCEHCIDINQSSLPSGLISTSEFWQVKNLQNPKVSVLFTAFSDFFRLIKLHVTCCHYELC